MRGWLSSAALFVLLLTVPLWAQRGGGGGHGGFGGGHMGGGHVGGGFSGGAHGGGSGYRGGYHGGNWGGGYHGWGGNGWHGTGWNNRGWYGRGWYGRGWYGNGWRCCWSYPYWGWGVNWGWYPGWGWGYYGDTGWDDSYSYSPDMSAYSVAPGYAASYPAAPTNAPSYPTVLYMTPDGNLQSSPTSQTQEQINQLQQQVEQLQSERQRSSSPKMTDVHYDTVLVYRDGHTETVGNYAIVGNTLWVFNETRARKVPLSELNVSATKRDNQERGNDFVVPASR